MKRPITLLNVVLEEILRQHNLSTSKDVAYYSRRLIEEGDSFATITLPSFYAAILAGIEKGFISRADFPGFRSRGKRGPLPGFLQGLVMKIFDINGVHRSDADPDAVFGIGMICNWLKKPKAECSPKRLRKALKQFVTTEEEIGKLRIYPDPMLDHISGILFGGSIFADVSSDVLTCRHGPGATAERLMLNERKQIKQWSERLNDVMPVEDHAILNHSWYDDLDQVHLRSLTQELPVRVVFVPKTMKTPRVIAIEPSYVQFAQQSVMDYLVERLETHPLTARSVHFTDQSVNKHAAYRASIDLKHATMDLSEASDRVSLALVQTIFARSPILPFLLGTRSAHASLDNMKTSFFLKKFASMGSATCFPVEAMVFYALIQRALHEYYKTPVSSRSILRFSREIHVYGDDLIVPSETRGIVTRTLEAYGLKVNVAKSFSNGPFRESCGGDYYKGYDVTPVYLRYMLPALGDRPDATVVESLVETSNLLYKRGLWGTAQALRDYIERLVGCTIPRTYIPGEGLTFFSYRHMTNCRYDNSMHTYAQKRLVLSPIKKEDKVVESAALFEALRPASRRSKLGYRPRALFPSVGFAIDFNQSVKRGVFKVKHRWIAATIGGR